MASDDYLFPATREQFATASSSDSTRELLADASTDAANKSPRTRRAWLDGLILTCVSAAFLVVVAGVLIMTHGSPSGTADDRDQRLQRDELQQLYYHRSEPFWSGGRKATLEPDFGEYLWALAIDGKDAKDGPNAYGQHFDIVINKSLPWMINETTSDGGCQKLSMQLIHKLRWHCCGRWHWREEAQQPMSDHMQDCFGHMSCDAVSLATADIPKDLIFRNESASTEGCTKDVFVKQTKPSLVRKKLKRFVDEYNGALRRIRNHSLSILASLPETERTNRKFALHRTSQEEKLWALVTFLRSFAWLHPWSNGNGRTRTLLLQRELRCRGLGPGALMFNNNRDIFFIEKETYVNKIREGVSMATISVKSNINPWTLDKYYTEHMRRFPPPANGKCFKCKCGWGSTE